MKELTNNNAAVAAAVSLIIGLINMSVQIIIARNIAKRESKRVINKYNQR